MLRHRYIIMLLLALGGGFVAYWIRAHSQPAPLPAITEIPPVRSPADYESLLDRYLAWKAPAGWDDVANPYQRQIVALGPDIVPNILKRMQPTPPIKYDLIWILGEIGVPEAFPTLLAIYQAEPSYRTAISIGSSLDAQNVEALFAAIPDDKELRKLLQSIYQGRWQEVQNENRAALQRDLLQNLKAIREVCVRISRPILG